MQIQSIGPSYFSKAYLKNVTNAKKDFSQANLYATNSITNTSFGSYYYSADHEKCKKLLDSYKNRFTQEEKLEILYNLRKMETTEKKSKILSQILKCQNKQGELADSLDIVKAMDVFSGKAPNVQRGLANMMLWQCDSEFSFKATDLISEFEYIPNSDNVFYVIGNLEDFFKTKMGEEERGQVIGDTVDFIANGSENYLPLYKKIALAMVNPKNKLALDAWDMCSDCSTLNEFLNVLLDMDKGI